MTTFKKLFLVVVGLCAMTAGVNAQDRGYHGDIDLATLIQKNPYESITSSHGFENGNGFYIGGGAIFEIPVSVDEKFSAENAPFPGPYEHDRMLGVFLESRYTFTEASLNPCIGLKIGPEYNLSSDEFQNAFARPYVGIGKNHLALTAGAEIGAGIYVVKGTINYDYTGIDLIHGCLEEDMYWSVRPFIGLRYQW